MNSRINPPFRGSVELLIVIPAFILLAWGVGWIGTALLQDGRLKRSAWYYAVSRAYGTDRTTAQRNAAVSFPGPWRSGDLQVDESSDCWSNLLAAGTGQSLPSGFRLELALNCSQKATLFSLRELSEIARIPGSDFRGSTSAGRRLKQEFWLEGMWRAGFRVPLQALGMEELAKAAFGGAAGINVGTLMGDLGETSGSMPAGFSPAGMESAINSAIAPLGKENLDELAGRIRELPTLD